MAFRKEYPHLVISSLKAAVKAHRSYARLQYTAFNWYFLSMMKREGLVRSLAIEDTIDGYQKIRVSLPFLNSGLPLFPDFKIVSKPSRRITVTWRQLKHILVNRKVRPLLRTEFGLEWGSSAVQRQVGGELLFYLYM